MLLVVTATDGVVICWSAVVASAVEGKEREKRTRRARDDGGRGPTRIRYEALRITPESPRITIAGLQAWSEWMDRPAPGPKARRVPPPCQLMETQVSFWGGAGAKRHGPGQSGKVQVTAESLATCSATLLPPRPVALAQAAKPLTGISSGGRIQAPARRLHRRSRYRGCLGWCAARWVAKWAEFLFVPGAGRLSVAEGEGCFRCNLDSLSTSLGRQSHQWPMG